MRLCSLNFLQYSLSVSLIMSFSWIYSKLKSVLFHLWLASFLQIIVPSTYEICCITDRNFRPNLDLFVGYNICNFCQKIKKLTGNQHLHFKNYFSLPMKINEKMNNSFPQIWNETSRDQSLLFAWGAGSKDLKGDHMIFRGNVRGGEGSSVAKRV